MQVNGFKNRSAVVRFLKSQGFNFDAVLSDWESNPKIAKNGRVGVMSSPLHLAPAKVSGFNMCAKASAGCEEACLHTAGNPAYMDQKEKARIAKTKAFMTFRKAFMALWAYDLAKLERKANEAEMTPSCRPNATSDYPFESVALEIDGKAYRNVFEAFPNVEFYDYSKYEKRAIKWAKGELPRNYHITFSKSEINDDEVKRVIEAGGNVAVVFNKLPVTYLNRRVINGDETDFRPLDPKGVIVGLKAKGDAKRDKSGFVVHI